MNEYAEIEQASPEDLDTIKALLHAASLPTGGVEDQFPEAFVVVVQNDVVVGAGALERYGDVGLLRSVVIARTQTRRGLGTQLVRHLLRRAAEQHLEQVVLLTVTAFGFFERLGFVPASRDEAPEAVQVSPEFASICPASAAYLVWSPGTSAAPGVPG